jgi:formiminotetrahydrofolate cyclodeaminase
LNVRINAKDLADTTYVEDVVQRAAEMAARAEALERETLALVDGKM